MYNPGDRVELVVTTDPHTALTPGDQGAVRALHPADRLGGRRLDVNWDSGSRLTLLIDEGDQVRPA
ncbi:DUF4314 domain-containing protein [Streptomyces sp. H27-C3]|uniref:DUF4314 domain-containing protein n=1 Tax=Streptomyces sp. H27-C3 TaxID=3046305 RepID=UPI0024B9B836|nr:DUF4314 domain-containing protein [Streptomyces sp. H27-C3]MDJ0465001.1 DUF4314 domain-containing protein [Streptomyces sp. H27-C3]